VSRFADALGQAKLAALDRIGPDLAEMGLPLTAFYIENISLPPEVEKVLDKRTEMGVLGERGRKATHPDRPLSGPPGRRTQVAR
jgi:hypothetical protein